MQNLGMTICPPLTSNNNTKQYDSTKSPLALLEQTCRSIGAETSTNKSSQSIDHTKKDQANGSHLNKLSHLNGYKHSSLAINQLANLANNYDGGRRSGNSSSEYARGSVSPASSLEKNRPNSNGNSRPNSNNSCNSSLTSSKGKELSKLSYKPYEEHGNDKRKRNSPEVDHLKSNKSDRKSNDSLNNLSPKNSNNYCPPKSSNTTPTSASLSYAQQQQQLIEAKYMELQYQQYMAALASGYPFNNPTLLAAASALTSNQLLGSNGRNSSSTSNVQQTTNSLPNLQSNSSTNSNLIQSANSCPPGCNSCVIHNPLLSSFAASTQTPSSVAASNNNSNHFNAQLAALSSQYHNIPPHILNPYLLAGYPSLNGLTPPVTSNVSTPTTNTTHSLTHSHHNQSTVNQTLQTNSNHNQLSMHQPHHLNTSSSNSNQHNNSSSNNKSTPHVCTFASSLNGTFCGKRFNNLDEYLIHIKSHPQINDFPNLNPASLESLYGSYEAILSGNQAIANLRRSGIHENLSSSRFHPYSKPTASNNYSQNNSNTSALSAMLPPSLSAATGMPFSTSLNSALGALNGLNGFSNLNNLNNLNSLNSLNNFSNLNNLNNLNNLSNLNNSSSSAAAAAFYSQYANGRVGPTVQP